MIRKEIVMETLNATSASPQVRRSAAERRVALKSLIAGNKVILVPGCYDAISAKLIEKAGFPAVYIGSYATSSSQFGLPDVGLVTITEIARHAKTIVNSVNLPVIADAENGFNHAANIWRTVQEFEEAGVAGIHIEDVVIGKHTDIPPVILPLEQMISKIQAALDARQDPNFLIVGRTDVPWALRDMKEMVRRANAFTEAGADLVLLTAVHPHKLREVRNQIKGKVVAGLWPGFTAQDLEAAGANVLIWYSVCLHAAYHGVKTALTRLKETTDIGKFSNILTDSREFENLVGYQDFVFKADKYGLK
jgi:2-methylisocitrate lyase-like PEP mutase family enzyme